MRYHYENTLRKHNVPSEDLIFDNPGVALYAEYCEFLVSAKDNRENDGELTYYLRLREYKHFLKSKAGLNRVIDEKEILKLTGLDKIHPEGFKEKRKANTGENDILKPKALELTAEEILIYLFNEVDLIENTPEN